MGRVTLAFGPEDAEDYIRSVADGDVSAEEMRADVYLSRARGYCVSDQDVTVGVAAIAVPVTAEDGRFLGALSVAGLRSDIIGSEDTLVPALKTTARGLG